MGHRAGDRTKLLGRIRRLREQMEAIERAVDEERDCREILHLVASVRGAIARLTNEVLDAHLQHHVLGVDGEAERRRGGGGAAAGRRRRGGEDLPSVLRSYLK